MLSSKDFLDVLLTRSRDVDDRFREYRRAAAMTAGVLVSLAVAVSGWGVYASEKIVPPVLPARLFLLVYCLLPMAGVVVSGVLVYFQIFRGYFLRAREAVGGSGKPNESFGLGDWLLHICVDLFGVGFLSLVGALSVRFLV